MPAMLRGIRDTEQDTVSGLVVFLFLRETDSELVKKKHFRTKNITRDKEDHFITTKVSVHQENIAILSFKIHED